MRILFLSFISFLFFNSNIYAQGNWCWQDPIDLVPVDLGSKYLGIANAAVLILSEILSEKDTSIHESERYRLSIYSEYHREYIKRGALSNVYTLKSRYGYQIRKWVTIGAEFQLIYMHNRELQTPAFGLANYYNWYIINKDVFKFLFDNGAGIVYSINAFPKEGTKFNFNTFYGISTQLKLKKSKYLTLGIRNMHISNAFLFGDDNNPAFDSIGFLVGIQF